VKEAALGSRGGNAQLTGGFADRALLQLADFDGRTNSGTKSGECVMEESGALLLDKVVFGIWSAVDELEAGTLLPFLIHEFHWNFAGITIAAQLHQGRVDGDSRQPGGQLRPAVEIIQVQQSAQEAVLKGVFRVFAIPGDTQSGMENLLCVALKELTEGRLIASSCGQEKLRIGRLLSGNPGEFGAVCQNVLLCSHDCFLLITCENYSRIRASGGSKATLPEASAENITR
jgi:hypothetical protein